MWSFTVSPMIRTKVLAQPSGCAWSVSFCALLTPWKIRQSVARVRRRPAKFTVSTGFNDMHFFAQVLKIPTIGYGPSGLDFHAVDERAPIKDLTAAAKIYADLLTTFTG